MRSLVIYQSRLLLTIMAINNTDTTEFEYEFLYNLRDQTMLFLKMNPDTQGYVDEILATLEEMVETLASRLSN